MNFILRNPCIALFCCVCLYLSWLLSSYNQVWMLPEEFRIKSYILEQDTDFSVNDIRRGLDWSLIENSPRLTRPLSSYFEIVDTKFRSWVWHYVPLHPSLSLTWIFSLVLSPLLLFLLLKNLGIGTNLAWGAVSLYMLTPGFLLLVVMLFRPAKAMTNFSIIGCLFLASRLARRLKEKEMGVSLKGYIGFLVVMFIGFFWDETALLIYPLVVLFFPDLLADKKRLILFLILPLLVFISYFYLFPFLVRVAGYLQPTEVYENMPKFETFSSRYVLHYMRILVTNSMLLVFDSLGLVKLAKNAPLWIWIWSAINAVVVVGGMGYVIYRWGKDYKCGGLAANERSKALRLIVGAGVLLVFHTYLMIECMVMFWGPYWYGAYWSIYFVLVIAYLVNYVSMNKYILTIGLMIICISQALTFMETNKIYKKFHYYPYSPLSITAIFRGEEGRFNVDFTARFSGEDIKKNLDLFKAKPDTVLLDENLWAGIETQPDKYGPIGISFLKNK